MGEVRIMAMLATMSSKKDNVEEEQRGNGGKTRPMLMGSEGGQQLFIYSNMYMV